MKPIPEYHRVTDDLFVWHGFDPEPKVNCSSTALRTAGGFVLVDPIRLEEQALTRMVGDDKVAAVVLTNANHQRGSLYEKERLDVPIYAPEGARGEVQTDHWYLDGETLLDTLKVVTLPGGCPGESALSAPGVLIVGDALFNFDGLTVLPEKYCSDHAQLRRSLARLTALDFDILCTAHGVPIVGQAKEKLAAALG